MSFIINKEQEKELENNYHEALKDNAFAAFVKSLKWDKEEVKKRTSKLQDSIKELKNCEKCQGLYECQNAYQGHVNMPEKENNKIFFTYKPCKYKVESVRQKMAKMSEENVNANARMKDIDISDKKRAKVIKWLDAFYEKYDFSKNMKGLYLHGNFGCGKTFLISALLHELTEKKQVETDIIYFPEILRELKSDWELYEAKMQKYQTIDILCIDDIGAEKVSEWGRDEVLGTILQSRMNANLTTFFTSNLNLEELEQHFLMSGSSEEKIKSRRIMERIKQLSEDMELLSENRRK